MTGRVKSMLRKFRKLAFWATGAVVTFLGLYMGFFLRAGDQRQMQSVVLDEARTYSVYLPSSYDVGDRYSVLYTLDGERWRHGAIVAANARMMAAFGLAPETIVVAVHTMGKRGRDYRPNYGAVAFTDFLENELIPEVEQAFPANDSRVLSGHSFGGLFALHVMTTRPHLFGAYFAYDPSVLPDVELLNRISLLAETPPKSPISLYMNYGFHTKKYEEKYDDVLQALGHRLAGQVIVSSSYYPLPHSMIMLPGQVEAMGFASSSRKN